MSKLMTAEKHHKYYWLVYSFDNHDGFKNFEEKVIIDIHPFKEIKDLRDTFNYPITIINWKEITEKEFNILNDETS